MGLAHNLASHIFRALSSRYKWQKGDNPASVLYRFKKTSKIEHKKTENVRRRHILTYEHLLVKKEKELLQTETPWFLISSYLSIAQLHHKRRSTLRRILHPNLTPMKLNGFFNHIKA